MAFKNECVLMERECTNCGECEICDLDPNKRCDNCCKCIETSSDYKSLYIDEIVEEDDELPADEEIENWKFDKDCTVEYKE